MNVAEEIVEELALMMAISDEYGEVLLKGESESYDDSLWYLHSSARNHMTWKKSLFQKIDENQK